MNKPKLKLYPYQKQMIASMKQGRKMKVVVGGRRPGKTMTAQEIQRLYFASKV